MKAYTTPAVIELGDVATMTADSGENASSDTIFRSNGRTGPGIGGSIDSCNFGEEGNCIAGPEA